MVFIASTISSVWPSETLSPTDEGEVRARFGLQVDGADHGRGHGAASIT
jgi:hypothetical protein